MAVFRSEFAGDCAVIHIDLTFDDEMGGTGTRDVAEIRPALPEGAWIGYDTLGVPCRLILHVDLVDPESTLPDLADVIRTEIPRESLAQIQQEFRILTAAINRMLSRRVA